MRIAHPFAWLSEAGQQRLLWPLVVCAVLAFVVISGLNEPLQTEAAPLGIVSLQLAGEMPRAVAVVESWRGERQLYAALNLGFDFLFLLLYAAAISLACGRVAVLLRVRSRGGAVTGVVLAWLVVAAGLLDALENYGLALLLLGSAATTWPAVILWLAGVKFVLVALALVYLIVGSAVLGLLHIKKR